MILVKNRQRKIPVNTQHLADQIADMLTVAGYPDFGVSILLTTNRSIRKFNKMFRGKDKPTDVLSFPYHPNLKPGKRINAKNDEDRYLGDIVISLEYALADAPKTWARPFRDHLVVLVAHGVAHLIGHDHMTDAQWKLMQATETKLLSSVQRD